jgi:hypothetical protein
MRLHRTGTIPPEIERELRALDAALAGNPVDAELSELGELALALRAERPMSQPEFVSALDARVAAGFPDENPTAPRPSKTSRRRFLPLAFGTAGALFILVTVGVTSGLFSGGGSDERAGGGTARTGTRPGQTQAPTESRSDRAQALSSPARPVPASSGLAAAPTRKVERAASITLSTPEDEIESVADSVIRTADRYRGFVLASRVASGELEAGATIELRIPTSRLQPAIADLSKLAHVKARSQNALDITARFSAPRRALAEATAERRSLLVQLAHAVTSNETASIKARLKLADRRITAARATLRRLERRVSYSAVSVAVEPGPRPSSGGSWSAGDAFGDALGVLEVSVGALVIAIAVLAPVTALLVVAWAARRAYLRRARNAALGPVEKPTAR